MEKSPPPSRLTGVELCLVDEAACLDVQVEGGGPVPGPADLLHGLLHEGEGADGAARDAARHTAQLQPASLGAGGRGDWMEYISAQEVQVGMGLPRPKLTS